MKKSGLKGKLFILLTLTGAAACTASCKAEEKNQEVSSMVEFKGFVGKEQTLENTDTMPANNMLYLETKSAQIKSKKDDTEYTSSLSSFQQGTATYLVEGDLSSVGKDMLEVTYPVFYVEKQLEEKEVLYPSNNEEGTHIELGDSEAKYPDAGQGVLVEVISSDLEQIPYQMTLKSNGETYEGAVSYYFDIISGDFEEGYWIISGITMEELGADTTVETSSVLQRYVATEFEIVEKDVKH